MNPDQIKSGKPASRGDLIVVPGLAGPGSDLIDEFHASQQPPLNRVPKGILGWCCQPSLDVAPVRRLRIAAAYIPLPSGVHEVVGHPIDPCSPGGITRV